MLIAESRRRVDLESYIADLRNLPPKAFDDVAGMEDFVRSHSFDPESLAKFLSWDSQHYTRNLIDHTDLYDLIAVCWEPGQGSPVHNHSDQHCWMSMISGVLRVQNYRVLSESLEQHRCQIVAADAFEIHRGEVATVMPEHPLHAVWNPRERDERAVSLHIYSRPFDRCRVYSPHQGTCGEIQLQFTTIAGRTPLTSQAH